MRFLIVAMLALSNVAMAGDLSLAPPSFNVDGKKAVFIDFSKVLYQITYNANTKTAEVVSRIEFTQEQEGYPLLDSVNKLSGVLIENDRETPVDVVEVQTPEKATKLQMVNTLLKEGKYTLVLKNRISKLVSFDAQGGVSSAYWMSDLSDRSYLETYMPSNLEFDHYKMRFEVKFENFKVAQRIYTNGKLGSKNSETAIVDFPAHFTASSPFFHTAPEGKFKEVKTPYKTKDGRTVTIQVYGTNPRALEMYSEKAPKVLQELENDYGAWPHNDLTIYASNDMGGGMEYCAATITAYSALAHELTHSYFARGIMPANGNAGWIDEAVASWRDNGYPRSGSINRLGGGLAGHSVYARSTDMGAYTLGADIMAYFDAQGAEKGGLKKFLASYVETYMFKSYRTEDFEKKVTNFLGKDVSSVFKRYIYAKRSLFGNKSAEQYPEHPIHRKFSEKELQALL